MPALPYSRSALTEENIRRQLVRAAMSMPSFAHLTEREIADLIAYLRTL